MKKLFTLFVCTMMVSMAWASITVSGVVTSAEDGLPVIGASVLEQGTTNGTITDFDGNYEITVADGATLEFSYVGMTTKSVVVKKAILNVTLNSDAIAMDEVVVTAMGVKQEKKRLNFAVQNVNSNELTESRSANVLNSLQGKVAGVNVTTSGGSPNAGSQLIIRGVTSISGSNTPLIVLDGMPISGGVGDLNPNDIEGITVLKGAAASALYGKDAASGVLMITTKSAQDGKVTATVNASWQFDTPANLIQVQQKYLPGSNGFYNTEVKNGWGPEVNGEDVIYDNVRNFFNDFGFYHKYDISLTGGTDKFRSFASVSYSKNDGIVPNDYRQKVSALVKGDYIPNQYIKMGLSANVINNQYRSAGSISGIYSWPINKDIRDYETEAGDINFLYYTMNKANSPFSPLWSRYKDHGINKSTRTLLQGYLTATPVKGLDLTVRLSYDQNNYSYDGYTVPRFSTTTVVPDSQLDDRDLYLSHPYLSESQLASISKSMLGEYSYSQSQSQMLTAQFLGTYHADLPLDFGLDVLVGAEMKEQKGVSSGVNGRNFVIPGVYSIKNAAEINGNSDVSVGHSQMRTAGVYGELRADYNGLASLSVTGRWDWSSTLYREQSPYFYPSVTAGLVFSELIPGLNNTKNNWFSYGKLRGNFAMVGNDARAPYLFDRRFGPFQTLPDGGYATDASLSVGFQLVPEMSQSWEVGVDLRFFDNKTRLDVAYYAIQTDEQIVTVRVPVTTGYVLQTRNEGTVRNQGVEITLGQDIIKRNGWLWTASLNMAFNRGRVIALPEGMAGVPNGQYGDVIPMAYLGGSTTSLTGKDYQRTEDGKIICDANGYPMISPLKENLIGDREPDLKLGLSTSVTYKGWSLSALFDGRIGGDVLNVTGRGLWSSGMHPALEHYRGRQVVWDGVTSDGNGGYVTNTKPIVLDSKTISTYYYEVSSNFIEDGSYLRLSYVTLSYSFANMLKQVKGIEDVQLAFTANNLFLLTRYTGSDPQINANTSASGTGASGIDNYAVPSTRSFNLSFQMTF